MTLSLPRARLAAIATDFADDPDRWRAQVRHDPHERWFTRLHEEESFEVWVLGWDRGQGLELHDHGGAAGAFAVVEGRLIEAHTDVGRRSSCAGANGTRARSARSDRRTSTRSPTPGPEWRRACTCTPRR